LHTPAINVPTGLGATGMPVGLQVAGPVGSDALTLAAAHAVHQHIS